MVKLEDANGDWIYINPSMVVSLTPVDGHVITRISLMGSDTEDVMGTPDEVHAKLFPGASGFGFTDTEKNEAMLEVLRWAGEAKGPWEDRLRVLARTALGWPLD